MEDKRQDDLMTKLLHMLLSILNELLFVLGNQNEEVTIQQII